MRCEWSLREWIAFNYVLASVIAALCWLEDEAGSWLSWVSVWMRTLHKLTSRLNVSIWFTRGGRFPFRRHKEFDYNDATSEPVANVRPRHSKLWQQ